MQAWEIYCSVFRQVSKHLSGLKSLDLRHVAPSLLQARNLKLAVPGKLGAMGTKRGRA